MTLPDSYTIKTGAMPDYFNAIIKAEAPERFSQKFLESLDFKSTNDRLLIGIMKDLGFIDTDGIPKPSYFELLDRSRWKQVLADAIRNSYSDLFAVNKDAQELTAEEVKNKLRTLYSGSKKDTVIANIAKTFKALCEIADFSSSKAGLDKKINGKQSDETPKKMYPEESEVSLDRVTKFSLDSLQYHINIVLPETRDQGVYDAIFKSLRDHLG